MKNTPIPTQTERTAERVTLGKHAIVIGGSVSGLLATRVLSDSFETVTLLERDPFPSSVENRKGVPQGWHAHGLLASGYQTLKDLFPNIDKELTQSGAHSVDLINDVRWFHGGYYKAKFPSGLNGVALSRPLLESVIRRRVVNLPNVQSLTTYDALTLLGNSDRSRVAGVRAHDRTKRCEIDLFGDFVVDASGRGSRSSAWLPQLGYASPEEETIKIRVTYSTCIFRRHPGDLDGDTAAVIAANPPQDRRLGVLIAIEDNRWLLTLGGYLGDFAPTDDQGFVNFAKSLGAPDIYDVVKNAETLSEIRTLRFPSSVRRHYEKLKRFPGHYVVIGDALCSFNPIHGQGITAAAIETRILRECLLKCSSGKALGALGPRFFWHTAKALDTAWTLAATADFGFPGVEGKRPMSANPMNWYVAQIHQTASQDAVVCRAFFDVANLLAPPSRLFRTDIMYRVVKSNLGSVVRRDGWGAIRQRS